MRRSTRRASAGASDRPERRSKPPCPTTRPERRRESPMISYDDVLAWIRRFAAVVAENKAYLTELDSAIGDADHGINMDRGFQAVTAEARRPRRRGTSGPALKTVGTTLISTVGGPAARSTACSSCRWEAPSAGQGGPHAGGVRHGLRGRPRRRPADRARPSPGDKTMVDALIPARDALRAALADGAPSATALERGRPRPRRPGMLATVPLVARKGRASYLGERSAGHQDPGATSSYLLLRSAAEALAGQLSRPRRSPISGRRTR